MVNTEDARAKRARGRTSRGNACSGGGTASPRTSRHTLGSPPSSRPAGARCEKSCTRWKLGLLIPLPRLWPEPVQQGGNTGADSYRAERHLP